LIDIDESNLLTCDEHQILSVEHAFTDWNELERPHSNLARGSVSPSPRRLYTTHVDDQIVSKNLRLSSSSYLLDWRENPSWTLTRQQSRQWCSDPTQLGTRPCPLYTLSMARTHCNAPWPIWLLTTTTQGRKVGQTRRSVGHKETDVSRHRL